MSSSPAGRVALRAAAAIALVESAVLVVFAIVELAADGGKGGAGVGVLLLLLGIGLAVAGIALARLRWLGRGPVAVAQLITLALAWQLFRGDVPVLLPVAMTVVALVALGAIISPGARAVLGAESRARGEVRPSDEIRESEM